MTNAAPECQPAYAGGGNNSARRREPECVRRMIDIAPGAAGAHRYRARGRIDTCIFYRREIDDETIVTNSEAARIVSAAADGQEQIVFSRKIYRADDIGHIRATRDQARPLRYHRIVNFAGVVIGLIVRLDHTRRAGSL